MQDRAAREVPTALHQRDPGEHLEHVGPRPHRRVRAHEPAGVRRGQQDLGIEGVAPLHRRPVHVRMAGRDRGQAARRAHRLERRIVRERRRIPQDVARVRGHQQRPLAHADIGLARDPRQAGLDLANHRAAAVNGELRHRRPALTVGRDPLALVLAQRAVLRRCGGRRVVRAAGGADPDRGAAHTFSLPSPAGRRRPEQAPRDRHAAVPTPRVAAGARFAALADGLQAAADEADGFDRGLLLSRLHSTTAAGSGSRRRCSASGRRPRRDAARPHRPVGPEPLSRRRAGSGAPGATATGAWRGRSRPGWGQRRSAARRSFRPPSRTGRRPRSAPECPPPPRGTATR